MKLITTQNVFQGKQYTGYLSFCAAINRSIDNGVDLISPEYYKDVTEDKLNSLLMGDNGVPCPMIKERVEILHGKSTRCQSQSS